MPPENKFTPKFTRKSYSSGSDNDNPDIPACSLPVMGMPPATRPFALGVLPPARTQRATNMSHEKS